MRLGLGYKHPLIRSEERLFNNLVCRKENTKPSFILSSVDDTAIRKGRQMSDDQQIWFCEDCQTVSQTQIDPHADVMTVVYKLGNAHHNTSPDCYIGASRLRVIDAEFVKTHSSWVNDVSNWAVEPITRLLAEV